MENKNYLIDMDGVLVHGQKLIPGADIFIDKLKAKNLKFLILTNNSFYTPIDLAHRLQTSGLNIQKEQIFTSAMATARFLHSQHEHGKAFVIGESGLTEALHDYGYILTNMNPDYVVIGESLHYNVEQITQAVRLIGNGAHFIATNPDPNGPSETGIVPACGALAALIEKASGISPFFIGKPNPFMMRSAIKYLGVHTENTVMVGDRMDTDIIAGIQSGLETILVLTGVTQPDKIHRFPYRPSMVLESVAHIQIE
jgi:NagD protein